MRTIREIREAFGAASSAIVNGHHSTIAETGRTANSTRIFVSISGFVEAV